MTDNSDSIQHLTGSMTSSWLQSAKAGDREAWERLVSVYGNLVRWWCHRGGVSPHDVDDLCQEVLAGLAGSLPEFEHESFRGFLWKITYHKIKDYWRTRRRQPTADGGSDIQTLLDNLEAESSRSVGSVDAATRIVFDAIVQLVRSEFSERDWSIFWNYAVEGKDATTVAQSHGVSRNQVFLAKSRILRRVRSEFTDGG